MPLEIPLKELEKVNPKLISIFKKEKLNLIKNIILNRYGTINKFAKEINCNSSTLGFILNAKRNARIHLSSLIIDKLNLEFKDVILKIVPSCRLKGSFIEPKDLPIIVDDNIAKLVGHCFGDGHLGKEFSYTNKNESLLRNLTKCVSDLPIYNLTSNESYHGAKIIRFSTLVRDILIAAGAPVGNKITNLYSIPFWIKNGDKKIKAAFLQALFDDEGSADVSHRVVCFRLSKNVELLYNLYEFMKDVEDMLEEFGIKKIVIGGNRLYKGKNGKTIRKELRIYGTNNLELFKKEIDFTNPFKQLKLKKIIDNTQHLKLDKNERREQIIDLLKNKPFLNAIQISSYIKMHHHATLGLLNKMYKDDIILKVKNDKCWFQHKASYQWHNK
jgi:intein/homing endonuclease